MKSPRQPALRRRRRRRSLQLALTAELPPPQLLSGLADEADGLKRMEQVLRWYISGWHVRPEGIKKPYNPVLGELFQCDIVGAGDTGQFTYIAEQVSHHPPMTAFRIEWPEQKLVLSGSMKPEGKFLGNSAGSYLHGGCTLVLQTADGEEVYEMTYPDAFVRNLMVGTTTYELFGKAFISCAKTGLKAELEFREKPSFGESAAAAGAAGAPGALGAPGGAGAPGARGVPAAPAAPGAPGAPAGAAPRTAAAPRADAPPLAQAASGRALFAR